jgi:hypothetical protein
MTTFGTFGFRRPGYGYFRVLGFGLVWKDPSRRDLMFSERNGYRLRLRIGRWRIGGLTPWI